LGTAIVSNASISPYLNDLSFANNFATINQNIIGSYDPNDKSVTPKTVWFTGVRSSNSVGQQNPSDTLVAFDWFEKLYYTIRFQNTGTFMATNVELIDTLPALTDVSSLQMEGSSHANYTLQITNGNVLHINYNNINLPDSMSNQLGSNGFAKFSIAPTNNWLFNLPQTSWFTNTAFTNTAQIYFDFNAPIFTNNAVTKFDITSSIKNKTAPNISILISPNPAKNTITITSSSTNFSYKIFNAIGDEVANGKSTSLAQSIDIANYVKGFYFIEVGNERVKFIKE